MIAREEFFWGVPKLIELIVCFKEVDCRKEIEKVHRKSRVRLDKILIEHEMDKVFVNSQFITAAQRLAEFILPNSM